MKNLIEIAAQLRDELDGLPFGEPVSHVYHPMKYAWASHLEYLRRFGEGKRGVLLVGMNPGPWGMVQTGVPFGDVKTVREWLGIEEAVGQPETPHPKRPVSGFHCRRNEASGTRLWGWARKRFGDPHGFFRHYFVLNYCPLCFFMADGRNLTPDKLASANRDKLFAYCDEALRLAVESLEPSHVLGIGKFAEGRIRRTLTGVAVTTGSVPHPSPASPAANRGWEPLMEAALTRFGCLAEGSERDCG